MEDAGDDFGELFRDCLFPRLGLESLVDDPQYAQFYAREGMENLSVYTILRLLAQNPLLPPGFHRIRHYGFLANRNRQQKLTECRRLLCTPPPAAEAAPVATDYRDRYEALTGRSLRRCPRCHDGNMQAVDHLAGAWGWCPVILDSS